MTTPALMDRLLHGDPDEHARRKSPRGKEYVFSRANYKRFYEDASLDSLDRRTKRAEHSAALREGKLTKLAKNFDRDARRVLELESRLGRDQSTVIDVRTTAFGGDRLDVLQTRIRHRQARRELQRRREFAASLKLVVVLKSFARKFRGSRAAATLQSYWRMLPYRRHMDKLRTATVIIVNALRNAVSWRAALMVVSRRRVASQLASSAVAEALELEMRRKFVAPGMVASALQRAFRQKKPPAPAPSPALVKSPPSSRWLSLMRGGSNRSLLKRVASNRSSVATMRRTPELLVAVVAQSGAKNKSPRTDGKAAITPRTRNNSLTSTSSSASNSSTSASYSSTSTTSVPTRPAMAAKKKGFGSSSSARTFSIPASRRKQPALPASVQEDDDDAGATASVANRSSQSSLRSLKSAVAGQMKPPPRKVIKLKEEDEEEEESCSPAMGRDTGRDAARDAARDSGRDSRPGLAGRDSSRSAGRNAGRDAGRDSSRDSRPGLAGRDSSRSAGRNAGRDSGRDSSRDSGRDSRSGLAGRDSSRSAGRNAGRDSSRDSGLVAGRRRGNSQPKKATPAKKKQKATSKKKAAVKEESEDQSHFEDDDDEDSFESYSSASDGEVAEDPGSAFSVDTGLSTPAASKHHHHGHHHKPCPPPNLPSRKPAPAQQRLTSEKIQPAELHVDVAVVKDETEPKEEHYGLLPRIVKPPVAAASSEAEKEENYGADDDFEDYGADDDFEADEGD